MESVCNETSKISHDFAKIEHVCHIYCYSSLCRTKPSKTRLPSAHSPRDCTPAAPPSHHLRILTINVEFFSNCEKTVEFNAPFVKRLLSALRPSDAPSDCLLIITLPKFLTSLASFSSFGAHSLLVCPTPRHRPETPCLFEATIEAGKPEKHVLNVQSKDGPTITRSFCRTCEHAHSFHFSVKAKAQIAERLLEIEQRHPLHPLAQGTHATTQSDGTTLAPHVGRNGKADASTGGETDVVQVLDVLHVQRIVVLFRKKGYLYIDLEVSYHQELYHVPFVAV
ncbi:hypothetical protein BLNAU_18352 [Blattamonas nauphoetae]|uniref:Uncharacterized protein n=1 Tax=Blattamonas nauphoetae TaxID=2049346 RepID=A0ABQ9X4Q3_9EUKA|nr:hypothetical protein BLNAU_18352 [Blattamonas nauphoetae]